MIYIVRHGQTDWNREHRIQGHMDIPLNEVGIKEAYVVKDKLKDIDFDLVFSSPLKRAYQTAQIITNKPIRIDDRLIERSNGTLEGVSDTELFSKINWDDEDNPYGIEKLSDLRYRVNSFLDEIINNYSNQNILVVTHAGIGIQIRTYFEGELQEGQSVGLYRLKNCEVLQYDNFKENKRIR